MPNPTLPRKFGVEIECLVPRGAHSEVVACGCNDDCGHDAYTHVYDLPKRWICKRDGSIHDRRGTEIVSPPLPRLDAIDPAVNRLNEAGAFVTDECGLHVHIDARDFDGVGISCLIRLWSSIAPAVRNIVKPERRHNPYCVAWTQTEREAIEQLFLDGEGYHVSSRHQRYRELNLAPYVVHGTVEFRLHEGTVEGRRIKAWTALCVEIVETARRMQKQSEECGLYGLPRPNCLSSHSDIRAVAKWLELTPYGLAADSPQLVQRSAVRERLGIWLDELRTPTPTRRGREIYTLTRSRNGIILNGRRASADELVAGLGAGVSVDGSFYDFVRLRHWCSNCSRVHSCEVPNCVVCGDAITEIFERLDRDV